MIVNYMQALDAAIVVKVGDAAQAVVKGINKIKPYGFKRNIISVDEFRNEMGRKFAGSGDLGTITFGGNWILGDTTGQDVLKYYVLNNTVITDMRVYLNNTDFFMPDTASDSSAAFQVTEYDPKEAGMNDMFSFTGELLLNGQPATFDIHHTSSTMVIAQDAGGDTITDATSGDFVNDGFQVGDTIILEGVTASADDYTQHIIAGVTATVITLTTATAEELTAQLTGSSFTMHCGRF